jgi:hypothetical protein
MVLRLTPSAGSLRHVAVAVRTLAERVKPDTASPAVADLVAAAGTLRRTLGVSAAAQESLRAAVEAATRPRILQADASPATVAPPL